MSQLNQLRLKDEDKRFLSGSKESRETYSWTTGMRKTHPTPTYFPWSAVLVIMCPELDCFASSSSWSLGKHTSVAIQTIFCPASCPGHGARD